jgi:SulP family sulfate permease
VGGIRRFLPRRDDYRGLATSWKGDVVAGITVGVVALPLALAFALSAGLSPAVGLTTAIVAGLVAGVFGGSDLQVSGPTGAMAVVLLPVVARFGAGSVATVGLMAGVLVLVAGTLRLGRVVAYVPWPVVEGFAVGIAVVIFLQQVPAALGVVKPGGTSTAVVAWRSVTRWASSPHLEALALVAIVAVVMVGAGRSSASGRSRRPCPSPTYPRSAASRSSPPRRWRSRSWPPWSPSCRPRWPTP